ncbi:MAG: aspartate carbamoyltransferase catalytic subunit [bacterium]
MRLDRKDLLGLEDLSRSEIELILETSLAFKEISQREVKKVPILRGKTILNLFFEPSTRTRASFELAEKRLSADTLSVGATQSSVEKGESLLDTVRNLEAMRLDFVVIRHFSSGAPAVLARQIDATVVNAGDGHHEHPTQGLLDLFTIKERLGKIGGLRVLIVGDVLHSRVARSNIWGLTKLGASVTVCAPPTLVPPGLDALGVAVNHDLDSALEGKDAVIVLRIQRERQHENLLPSLREYSALFGLNEARLARAKPGILVLHPGPMNRGVEISQEVADGPNSVILDQVTNGVAVRMAVIYLLAGGESGAAA